ncbi:MAG TPA: GNAT family N-acetyltransferase [Bacteroidales bacterium]
MNLQPENLEDGLTQLIPSQEKDFEALYEIASDPKIWEQHPISDRYKKEVFLEFFEGAMACKSSFVILDKLSGKPIGSTRFYNYDEAHSSIAIGYTFLSRNYWGGTYNRSTKKLLLDYAFKYVETVIFHIGVNNIRSQKAIDKIGATKTKELYVDYGGKMVLNYEYEIKKHEWLNHTKSEKLQNFSQ